MLNIARRLAIFAREVDDYMLASNGSRIDMYSIKTDEFVRSLQVDESCEDIFKIIEGMDGLFVLCEKCVHHVPDEILYYTKNRKEKKSLKLEFEESIVDACFFYFKDELIVVSRSLAVRKLKIDFDKVTSEELSYHIPKKIALFVSCHIIADEDEWENLTVIGGSSSGEITIFRPATGQETTCFGQDGVIFSMCRFESKLFCVSDDRTLSVYDCSSLLMTDNEDSDELILVKLDEKYGHSARPFAVNIGEDGTIYSAGQEETLLRWQWTENGLKLLQKKEVKYGTIRTICVVGRFVFLGTDSGAFVRVYTRNLESEPIISWKEERSVKSFVRLSNGDFETLRYEDAQEFRFLSRIPFDACESKYVALVGDKSIQIRDDKHDIKWTHCLDDDITDVFVDRAVAFVYLRSAKGLIFGLRRHVIYARLHFGEALEQLHVTTTLKFTAFAYTAIYGHTVCIMGTSTGQIFYCMMMFEESEVVMRTCPELNSAFKKSPINQIISFGTELQILGRNGVLVLCSIRATWEIAIISARPLCPWLKGFTPSGLDDESRFVFGFKGKEFLIVDYFDREVVDSIDCGGPNRQWYFTTYRPSRDSSPSKSTLLFDFLSKGTIYTAHLEHKYMTVLASPPHRSRIIGITLISDRTRFAMLATIGADHFLLVFRVFGPRQGREFNLSLYNEATPTSVCSSVVMSGEFLVMVGGEKGSVTTWFINPVDLITLDPRHVISYEYRRSGSSARVMCVDTNCGPTDYPDLDHYCVAAYADGVFEVLKVVFDEHKLGISMELVKRIDRNPLISVPTRVHCFRRQYICPEPGSDIEINAVTTSGRHAFYNVHPSKPGDPPDPSDPVSGIHLVENCGLSAICVLPILIESLDGVFLIIGSESGRITTAIFDNEGLKIQASATYHSSTVTGVFGLHRNGHQYIGSVGLDCRFVLWEMRGLKRIELVKSFPLDVRDPCNVQYVRDYVIIIGDGMQYIDLEPYYR